MLFKILGSIAVYSLAIAMYGIGIYEIIQIIRGKD